MFRVHTERVAAGDPERWMLVLHGVFGSGANWRLFCRRLAQKAPRWGFLLCDLRGHGGSLGGPPPHDLNAAATDLLAVEPPVDAVMGHSLGGKVALAYAALRPAELDLVWVLDSRPGPRDDGGEVNPSVVLAILESLPESFADRNAFVEVMVEAGQTRAVAAWLAMNLRRHDDGRYRLQLELPVIRAILGDYFRQDLWPELERADPRRELHFVVAGRSPVLSPDDRARLHALQGARVHVHTLADSGHWVNVDAPEALERLVLDSLEF